MAGRSGALVVFFLLGCVSGGGDTAPFDAHADARDAATDATSDGSIFETEPTTCSCTADKPLCSGGTCSCPAGGTLCGGECVDLAGDPRNCESCGNACGDNQYCRLMAGPVCKCRPPAVACTGVCRDRNSDPNACGACDAVCPKACARGACVDVCPSDLTGCSVGSRTACVDVRKDPANCGACGTVCTFDEVCANGHCVRYRPAVGCATCPCAVCATVLPGSTCCPPLTGQPSSLCVFGASCPT